MVATAHANAGTFTVNVAGTGSGTVVSTPAGIECTTADVSCAADFVGQVQLLAVQDEGSVFVGWSTAANPFVSTCRGPANPNPCSSNLASSITVTATFDLIPPEPVVSNGVVGPRTQTTAVLNGSVDNNGDGEGSDCEFEVTTPGDTGFVSPVAVVDCAPATVTGDGDVPVSATATGLAANTSYIFRVVATNGAGTGIGDPPVGFQTLPNPPVVAHLAPQNVTQVAATIRGQVNNQGAAGGSSCQFQITTVNDPGFAAAVATPACSANPVTGSSNVTVTAAVGGLSANTAYIYRVVAQNSGGQTTGSPVQGFTTLPNPPDAVTGAASQLSQTSVALAGTVDNSGAPAGSACSFDVALASGSIESGVSVPCAVTPVTGSGSTAVAAAVSGLSPNRSYVYRLRAQSAGGVDLGDVEVFETPPNPPAVSSEAAVEVTETAATLTAAVNPWSSPVTVCEFEWGPTETYGATVPCSGDPGGGFGAVAVSAARLTGLLPGATYHFHVIAANGGGETIGPDQTFATQAVPPPPPPPQADPPRPPISAPPTGDSSRQAPQRAQRVFRTCRGKAIVVFRKATRRADRRLAGRARTRAKRAAARRRDRAVKTCRNRLQRQLARTAATDRRTAR